MQGASHRSLVQSSLGSLKRPCTTSYLEALNLLTARSNGSVPSFQSTTSTTSWPSWMTRAHKKAGSAATLPARRSLRPTIGKRRAGKLPGSSARNRTSQRLRRFGRHFSRRPNRIFRHLFTSFLAPVSPLGGIAEFCTELFYRNWNINAIFDYEQTLSRKQDFCEETNRPMTRWSERRWFPCR